MGTGEWPLVAAVVAACVAFMAGGCVVALLFASSVVGLTR